MAITVFLKKKIRYSLLSDKCLRWNWQQLLKFAWLALPSRAPNCKPAVAIAGRSGSTGPFERRGRGTCARVFPALQFCERWFDEENAVEKNLCCYFCYCCLAKYDMLLRVLQDFLIKLDIKPLMHLLEISAFSLSSVIIRLTKKLTKIGHIFSK